jgi:hypothetical protein
MSFIGWVMAVVNAGGLVFLIYQVCSRYPVNHWGANVRWGYIPAAVGAAVAIFGILLTRKRASAWVCGGAAVLLGVGVFLIDALNLLVEYELWIERGMPGPWRLW